MTDPIDKGARRLVAPGPYSQRPDYLYEGKVVVIRHGAGWVQVTVGRAAGDAGYVINEKMGIGKWVLLVDMTIPVYTTEPLPTTKPRIEAEEGRGL